MCNYLMQIMQLFEANMQLFQAIMQLFKAIMQLFEAKMQLFHIYQFQAKMKLFEAQTYTESLMFARFASHASGGLCLALQRHGQHCEPSLVYIFLSYFSMILSRSLISKAALYKRNIGPIWHTLDEPYQVQFFLAISLQWF